MVGRVAYRIGLENRRTETYRGFKSLTIRFAFSLQPAIILNGTAAVGDRLTARQATVNR